MFDLKTIQALNSIPNPCASVHALVVRLERVRLLADADQPIGLTRDERAFNRRVALLARDLGVERNVARAIVTMARTSTSCVATILPYIV